jgi:integrase
MAAKKQISTELQVTNLKPRGDRYEVAQAKSHARLVVFPSGAKSWVFRYRFGGRTRKMTLDAGPTDLTRARELATAAYNKMKAGTDPGEEKQELKRAGAPMTVKDLLDRYLDVHVHKTHNLKGEKLKNPPAPLRSAAEIKRVLEKELAPFNNRRAAGGISTSEAEDLVDDVAERGVIMANRTLAYLKAMFGSDAAKKRAGASNPFEDLKLTDEEGRTRVLSAAEFKAAWSAAGELGFPFNDIVRLLALTGQRLNEIARLRWNEIDFDKRQIELPGSRTKNGRDHIVPLSDAALEILKAAPKIKSAQNLVFTLNGNAVSGWSKPRKFLAEAVTEALGYEPERWTLHDLRRTAATRMAEDLKIPPHIVDKILNHSTGVVKGVAAIYNRAELLDERRAALAAWASYVERMVSGNQPANVVPMSRSAR